MRSLFCRPSDSPGTRPSLGKFASSGGYYASQLPRVSKLPNTEYERMELTRKTRWLGQCQGSQMPWFPTARATMALDVSRCRSICMSRPIPEQSRDAPLLAMHAVAGHELPSKQHPYGVHTTSNSSMSSKATRCAPNESPPGPRAVREPLDQVAPPSAASHVSEPTMFPLRLPGCPAAFRMWHLSRSNQCLLEKNWVPPGAEKRGGGYSVRGDGEGKFFDCPPGEKECTIVPRTGNGPPRADFGKGG